ncbi:transcriptional regulator [Mycolicibacterium moriokaense]|uniref:Transcriptional regulator n=1 Tax=Mycolicibacterium moriokaense TaxID=39691 RepID=A0AAD1HGM7_9MYCO|nr:transcriptional regulator [Mycolicibacterium moriokaense]
MAALAPGEGVHAGRWPGLTIYRFTRPSRPQWVENLSVSLVVTAQSGHAEACGERLVGGVNHLVAAPYQGLDWLVLGASQDDPVLGLVLPIDPALVRSVTTSVRGMHVAAHDSRGRQRIASIAGTDIVSTAARFLESLRDECDRRVLAPLLLRELVYHVLRGEQGGRLIRVAAQQTTAHPVGVVMAYIDMHIAEPLTVDALAAQVCLSPSSLSRVFREATGCGPHQYVKEARLVRARQLLDGDRCTVAEAARQVGYVSVSNFIKAFHRRFGSTPGDYASAHPFRRAC